MIVMQTKALLVDAYRELNARKLFWITMILTGVMVGIFASIGVNNEGVTLLWWTFRGFPINDTIMPPELFYKTAFLNLGIGIWLTWVAMALALISTAGMIPDLISGGSIETVLSKPISRLRLFLSKYILGLLFVVLQTLVFSLGCFLVFGLRAGLWEPRLFLAIPIVTLFYSYLACMLAFVGLVTRSTIAGLLLTLLFWFLLFVLNYTDVGLMAFRVQMEMQLDREQARIVRMEANTDRMLIQQRESQGEPTEGWTPTEEDRFGANPFLRTNSARVEQLSENLRSLRMWSRIAYSVKTTLPKTTETSALLKRYLIDTEGIPGAGDQSGSNTYGMNSEEIKVSDEEMAAELQQRLENRPLWWIIGTSLGFEALILAICCWIFSRRDF